jgi:PAS domain S-box-containing protein
MGATAGPMLEQAFAFFFEHSDQAYYVFDPDSLRFMAVNGAAIRRYGYTRDEFKKMTVRDIRPPEDLPAFFAANFQAGLGVKHVGRFRHRARDGRIIPVERGDTFASSKRSTCRTAFGLAMSCVSGRIASGRYLRA